MIDYAQFGSGPTKIVGLHGWFGDETTFTPLERSLDPAAVQSVWTAHRGYGRSRDLTGSYTMAEMAQDALDITDHLGWESFSVIGHSMGGKAAQLLAAQAPSRVDKLVVIAGAPANPVPFDPDTRALFDAVATDPDSRRAVIDHSTGNRLSSVWIDHFVNSSIERVNPTAQAAYLKSWADDDLVELVTGCEVDTLVLAGSLDPVITPEVCDFVFRDRFSNYRVEALPNSGHYPMEETPLAVGAAVATFLSSQLSPAT